tara:strand:- start:1336 stop:1782 length:447 start_codon:yes stop_codon:yes gene_type:complete
MLWCETCQEEEGYFYRSENTPTKRRHKKCGGYATQRFDERAAYKMLDESQKRRKWVKYEHEGMTKSDGDAFLKTSIAASKNRMESGNTSTHYTPMVPNMDYMVKNGLAKPITDEKNAEKLKVTKEVLTKVTKDGKKINLNRTNKRQTI